MPVSYWLIGAVIFVVIEIVTLSLASVWFAGGALAGALMAYLHMPLWSQLAAFIIVTAIMLAVIAPLARDSLNQKKQATNIDSLIGQTCLVTEDIDNLKSVGQVNLKGQVWSARSYSDDIPIRAGQKVSVRSIAGVKLIVIPKESDRTLDCPGDPVR